MGSETNLLDVAALGEVLLRYSVPAGYRLEQARSLDVHVAGAECNVVTALARLGHRCAFFSALPRSPLGRLAAEHLRACGVSLDGIVWSASGRMGTYYVEFAEPPRPLQVVYDRADTCAAQLSPEALDWDLLLAARLIHVTGITAALRPNGRALVEALVERARARGVPISFDVNYRARLWTPDEASAALRPLIAGVEVLFCKAADAELLFGFGGPPGELARALAQAFGAQACVVSAGAEGAYLWFNGQISHAPAIPVTIVDRIGAGDALSAGVLHGWLNGDLQRGLHYGTALAALALTQHGDSVVTTSEELEAIVSGQTGGLLR